MIISKKIILLAKSEDEQAKIQILNWLKSTIESEVVKYCSNPDYDIYSDLIQEGVKQVLNAIQHFNTNENEVTKKYFYIWIKGGILRHYEKYFNDTYEIDEIEGGIEDGTLRNEISDLANRNLLTPQEIEVFKNYRGSLLKGTKLQKELAEEMQLHQTKISRLYNSALEKIINELGWPANQFTKKKINNISTQFGKQYTSEEKLKKVVDIFKHLNDMLPSHMPYFKIEKNLKDGSYRASVWQGIPVTINKSKNSGTVDTETPQRELEALMNFVQSFMDSNQKYNESTIMYRVPKKSEIIDFIRFYAPYTTRNKMKILLEKLDINPSTIRVYLNEDPTVRFNRKKSELFLTIFDNYIMRSNKRYIEFKDIEKILRVITVNRLLELDSNGLIKPPYKVDKKRKILKKIM